MADGVILKASAGNKNNPSPEQNLVVRTGDITAGTLTDVDLTQLERLDNNSSLSRVSMLAAVRTGTGKLKLIVFEQTEDGKELTRLGAAEGVAMRRCGPSQLAAAVRTAAGNFKVFFWSTDTDPRSRALGASDGAQGAAPQAGAPRGDEESTVAMVAQKGTCLPFVMCLNSRPQGFAVAPCTPASKLDILGLPV